jgi:tetratricopeptide (TPR) repeat protein
MLEETLKFLLAGAARTPAPVLPRRLDALFRRLAAAASDPDAAETEDLIWGLWMEYPVEVAADRLEEATRLIAGRELEHAEALLDALVTRYPDFAEAWNKRATLYFLQGRDDESVRDIRRTLELEPRHFGAICGFGQICLRNRRPDLALFALQAALDLNPHLAGARRVLEELKGGAGGPVH